MTTSYIYTLYIHILKTREKTVKVFEIKFGRITPETGLALPFHNCIGGFMASE